MREGRRAAVLHGLGHVANWLSAVPDESRGRGFDREIGLAGSSDRHFYSSHNTLGFRSRCPAASAALRDTRLRRVSETAETLTGMYHRGLLLHITDRGVHRRREPNGKGTD